MHFCKKCQNMYYLKINNSGDDSSEDGIVYYCRNCGHSENSNEISKNICISNMELSSKTTDCGYLVNEYTKYDPTLPKTNKIKCPNTDCPQYAEKSKEQENENKDQDKTEQI